MLFISPEHLDSFGAGRRRYPGLQTVEDLIKAGVKRVILGTRAIEDRKFLKNMLASLWREDLCQFGLFQWFCDRSWLGFCHQDQSG